MLSHVILLPEMEKSTSQVTGPTESGVVKLTRIDAGTQRRCRAEVGINALVHQVSCAYPP